MKVADEREAIACQRLPWAWRAASSGTAARRALAEQSARAGAINDVLTGFAIPEAPFGGVRRAASAASTARRVAG
jgi:hypothetical protein